MMAYIHINIKVYKCKGKSSTHFRKATITTKWTNKKLKWLQKKVKNNGCSKATRWHTQTVTVNCSYVCICASI